MTDQVFQAVSVPGVYLADAISTLVRDGQDQALICGKLGVELEALRLTSSRLSAKDYIAAMEDLLSFQSNGILGLQVAKEWGPDAHGVVADAMLCAPTVGDAIQFMLEYEELTGPVIRLAPSRRDSFFVLTVVDCGLSDAILIYEVQNTLAGLAGTLSQLGGVQLQGVSFAHEGPTDIVAYLEAFQCEISFKSQRNEAWLLARDLDIPLKTASPEQFNLLQRQCEVIRNNLMRTGSLPEQIRRAMLSTKASFPSEEQVASRLGMSTRTLRRRLSEEGVHFREMLNESRVQLAQEYLKSTALPVSRIATIVGYASTPSFHRAFKHFTGVTPAIYRDETCADS